MRVRARSSPAALSWSAGLLPVTHRLEAFRELVPGACRSLILGNVAVEVLVGARVAPVVASHVRASWPMRPPVTAPSSSRAVIPPRRGPTAPCNPQPTNVRLSWPLVADSTGEPDFWAAAQRHPSSVAVIDPWGRSSSFGQLFAKCNQIGRGLQSMGVGRGDVIVTPLRNCLEAVQIHLAAMQVGVYWAPVHPGLTAREFQDIFEDCNPKLIVTGSSSTGAVIAAAEATQFDRGRVYSVDAGTVLRPFSDVWRGQDASPMSERSAGEVLLFTSGTTGRPRAVKRPLPDGPPRAPRSFSVLPEFSIRTGLHLNHLPLAHRGTVAFAAGALHTGRGLVLVERPTPLEILAIIDGYRISSVQMAPIVFRDLLDLPDALRGLFDLRSLQVIFHGTAPCPIELKRRMLEWLGPILWEGYGSTEGRATVVNSAEWLLRPGTVGRPLPGGDIKILDDAGAECPPGVNGNVFIRPSDGRQFEYLNDQVKTRAAWRDGYFSVGDVGYLDDEGWLFLTGRTADIINVAGSNVYGAEVEMVLMQHSHLTGAAVIGVPSERHGEEVLAVIEAGPGHYAPRVLVTELEALCKRSLAEYKQPERFEFRDQLPRSPEGKLLKSRLREEYSRQRAIEG